MKKHEKIAVTSRSFSKHPVLRNELTNQYEYVRFNDEGKSLKDKELIDFLQDCDMAIVGLERLTESILTKLPRLKRVSRFGVGTDTLDLEAMKRLNIELAVTSGVNKRSVSELVIAFALTMLRQLPQSHEELKAGIWQQRKGQQLSEKCVGIIGLGAVGKDLALLLRAFNCKILAFDLLDQSGYCNAHQIKQVDLHELLKTADVISVHIPFNEKTKLLLNENTLPLMKSTAVLINTARGGIVDEDCLKRMLETNQIAGAAFDVFAQEPPTNNNLLTLPNFFCTPHIAGSTEEAIIAMGRAAILGLDEHVLITG